MEPRIFHGNITPKDIARALMGEFNRGDLEAQSFGEGEQIVVQIKTRAFPKAGGQTALTVGLHQVEDGVAVQIGKQAWIGVAASLGKSLLTVLRNPWGLIERMDDVAQDIENLRLSDEVWRVIENTARSVGATFELSERFRRLVCEYCLTANPVGEAACIACGAPLGPVQPDTCPHCGFLVKKDERVCPNCGKSLI